jgi:FkbM family methyltransferase
MMNSGYDDRLRPPHDLRTASPLKLRVSQVMASATAGRLIGAATRKRIRHQGLRFDVRSSDFSPVVRAQMFWGTYEGAETRMIRGHLRNSAAVVELGSSLGITAAHVAAVMAPRGHLVCVEANPRLLPGLQERILARAAALRVDVIHAAIGSDCGVSPFIIAAETVASRLGEPRPGEFTVQVPALTLREVLRKTEIAEFDLISDIEGAEAAFLVSDPGVLDKCGRAVIELHDTTLDGQQVTVRDLLDAALAAGFDLVSQHGPVVALARH